MSDLQPEDDTSTINDRLQAVFNALEDYGYPPAAVMKAIESMAVDVMVQARRIRVEPVPVNLSPNSPLVEFEDGNIGLEFEIYSDGPCDDESTK